MSSTAALRDLYEALEMLDAQQTGRSSDRGLDLRDTSGPVTAGSVSRSSRTAVGSDWDANPSR
jgi:hypothetical protein